MGHNACVLKSDVAGGGETCLLGTNVTIPLGLIIFAQGVEVVRRQASSAVQRNEVCLQAAAV